METGDVCLHEAVEEAEVECDVSDLVGEGNRADR
jgi:hypothetical protein